MSASVEVPEPMPPFDLLGPLPEGTTLLEASAGTGKTYAVGALVTRFVAEGVATLDQMLVITFGRAASQELRERVREQLVAADRALADPTSVPPGEELLRLLVDVGPDECARRRRRVRDALADFDAATIATTHQFCQMVLRSLGVAGDTDSGAELVEDLDDLVVEVVDDTYLRRYGHVAGTPPFNRTIALELGRAAVGDPQALLAPADAEPGSRPAERRDFALEVRHEVGRRKRLRGVLSYDDLLVRLAEALDPATGTSGGPGAEPPARERMRERWRIVLVDEFQDTDPVQWAVLDRAFSGHATMVLIGDPKQAIYAFRGGDVVTYLDAAETAGTRRTLATNWRSDRPLVDALQALLGSAALGDRRIAVHPVHAANQGSRLQGAPVPDPLRLRVMRAADFPTSDKGTVSIDTLRAHVAEDLADDVARLLSSGATFEGREVEAGDVAVLIYSLKHVGLFQDALAARGIASVVSGGRSVLLTQAGEDWLSLLEVLEQPHRAARVRAVALTPFVGHTAAELDAGGDALTDDVGERARRWLDLLRARGIAAVHEAVVADGLAARVLATPGGERRLTDLTHLGQVLHEVSHRERLGVSGLLEWLRAERRRAATSSERTRRLDTDARAVQLVTIHASKGLQYPVVHLPLLFDKWVPDEVTPLFHDDDGRRTLDVGGTPAAASLAAAREEAAGEELRLTYVALTRAQSQVVTWWGPSWNAGTSGLTRLLLGREPGQAEVPQTCPRGPSDVAVETALEAWQTHGALHLEVSELRRAGPVPGREATGGLAVRPFGRDVDTEWRRTSYSGLIRAEDQRSTPGVDSEPELEGTVDESAPSEDEPTPVATPAERDRADDLPSPLDGLPAGATFGSLVHAVLEHADPQAPDLLSELTTRVAEQRRWWSVDAPTEAIAEALLPMQHTSLGPLAGGLTLAEVGLGDRLRELDFEFPLAGGEHPVAQVPLRAVADALRAHLPADDPMRAYADRLEVPSLGDQVLRGYLSGSIDVVLRAGGRFLVVDYKTNRLGSATPGEPLTALDYTPALMTEAMLHSHYPLQALLYSVVLHRFLRWRLGSAYSPEEHLGGILYLYVRGMCGPETPLVDGQPCGVFSWRPPAALVEDLSDLLAGLAAPADGGRAS